MNSLKKLGQILLPLVVSVVLVFIGLFGFTFFEQFIYQQVFPSWGSSRPIRFLFSLLYFFLIIGIFCGLSKLLYKDIRILGFSKRQLMKNLLTGYLSGIILMTIAALGYICFSQGQFSIVWTEHSLLSTIAGLVFYFIQGTQEEVISRGFIQGGVAKTNSLFMGVVASSVFFTLMHVGNVGGINLELLNFFVIALVWALFRVVTKNTWFVAAMHGAYNFSEANLFGLAHSIKDSEGTIFQTIYPEGFEYMHLISASIFLVTILLLLRKKKVNWFKPYTPH